MKELILETFIVVVMVNGTEIHGKNLMSYKILTRNIIAKFIVTLALINIKVNVEHHYNFGKIKARLIL